ncbi:DUF4338 domain-containing protein [Pelagibacter phage Mosig EXVC030M]|nr:DUF4338 domain-containing protein [Pelagibacter phage Mosig EXVC030M]
MTYSWKKGMSIDDQWQSWQDNNPLDKIEAPDTETLKEAVIKDLSYVSSMDVKEYTLYQKWCEVKDRYPTVETNSFFDDKPAMLKPEQGVVIQEVKNNFWLPEDPEEYLELQPELIWTDGAEVQSHTNAKGSEIWNALRTFLSTMKNNSNIGRNLNFLIRDKVTKKYLGVTCMSSDFLDLTPRDEYIGWDREAKTQRMINHTCIGSTIVPIQPLGYNLVGGKLLALLCLSDTVEKTWEYQYKDKLVGVTTTSLYGKTKEIPLSQYDRLKHWKKMGWTAGSVSYEPTKPTRMMIQNWLKKNHTYKYFEWYVAKKDTGQPHKRDHRNRSHTFTYNQLGIDKKLIKSDHARGIYFGELYENTREFLKEEITVDKLVRKFDNSTEALTDLWKNKYAKKRLASLKKQGRVSTETHFYDDIIYLSWEETKQKYLPQVGR